MLKFENMDSRNGTFSLEVHRVCCGTTNFTVCRCKQLLGGQNLLCDLCKLAGAVNLRMHPTPSQGGKPENLCILAFIWPMDYIYNCDVVLVVIDPSKNTFHCF